MEISENESILLFFLFEKGPDSTIPEENALNSGLSAEEIRSASSWLKIKGLIDIIEEKETRYELGEEGFLYLEDQFPEERLISLLRERKEIPVNEIASIFREPSNRIALAQAAKLGFPPMNGKLAWDDSKGSKALKEIEERREILEKIKDGTLQRGTGDKILDHLLKRGNVIVKKQISRKIFQIREPGKEYVKSNPSRQTIGEISPEILLSGSWRDKALRKYDLNLHGKHVERVGRHPLDYLIREIRSIFLEMGFTEMVGNYVESTGWNMDSLFIPQDHPARDMQDTFYLSSKNRPEFSEEEIKLFRKFGRIQTNGLAGYKGYGGKWNLEESKKLVLRTHTTPNTIRYLARHKNEECGFFSVDKVFRHESVDWKHLAEFHQIEGAVQSRQTSLATLKWFLKYFYERLGFRDIRLVPSYYPYTEPSMDVVVRINGKDVELGGSGIFRPEVLKPLGIKYPVMAWGLGLERLALTYYGLEDLRQLYESDIEWLRNFKVRI